MINKKYYFKVGELVNIGSKIKAKRKELKLTQSEVAEKLGIARSTYTSYELEKIRLNSDILRKLDEILELNIFRKD